MAVFDPNLSCPFFFEGGDHAILLTHGFTSTAASMRQLGELLNKAGYTVRGIQLKGHGTKAEDMLTCTWRDWLRQELETAEAMRKEYRHFTVCGLSMGGVLSLIAAEKGLADECVALSAPMKTDSTGMAFSKVAALFRPTVSFPGKGPKPATIMPEYAVGYHTFPTKSGGDLSHLMRIARTHLADVKCPLLVVQSTGDRTISLESAGMILNGVGTADKQYLELEGYPHAVTVHHGAVEKIAEEMDTFLKKRENCV